MLRARDVLDPTWVKTYETYMRTISNQLLVLNTNLFILEKIAAFNFDLFGDLRTTFWAITSNALYESSVMCAWRVAVDSGSDCLTISKLRDAVIQHLTSDRARDSLKENLRNVRFDLEIRQINRRIENLRRTRLAHLLSLSEPEKPIRPGVPPVTLQDLRSVTDVLNIFLDILGLGTGYGVLSIDYDPNVSQPTGTDPRPDIVRYLDDIATNSAVVNMPEQQPDYWPYYSNDLTEGQIDQINHYRSMMGKQLV